MRGVLLFLAAMSVATASAAQGTGSPMIDTGSTALLAVAGLIGLLAGLGGIALITVARTRLPAVPALIAGAACVTTLIWVAFGYSLAFGPGSALMGGLGNIFLVGLANTAGALLIPESIFAWYHLAWASAAACLLVGAIAHRVRTSWALLFVAAWLPVVYAPIARWLWAPEGWLGAVGTVDFAGGLVVHLTAAVGAFVVLMRLGRTRAAPEPILLPFHLAGVACLWIGLLALGSAMALAATDLAGSALLNLQLAASAGALAWVGIARLSPRAGGAGGVGGGALAGLAAASAGAGYLAPFGAILLGLSAGAMAAFVAGALRRPDDRANIIAVHGVPGALGAVLLVPLAAPLFGGAGFGDDRGFVTHVVAQIVAIVVVVTWSAVMSYLLVRIVALVVPMRLVRDEDPKPAG